MYVKTLTRLAVIGAITTLFFGMLLPSFMLFIVGTLIAAINLPYLGDENE